MHALDESSWSPGARGPRSPGGGGQQLNSTLRFPEVGGVLGVAGTRAVDYDGLCGALRTVDRPAAVEVLVDDRTWPGPSPFFDPARVRTRFEATITAGRDSGTGQEQV